MKKSARALAFGMAVLILGALPLAAQSDAGPAGSAEKVLRPDNRIVGSWFGRAEPIDPFCPPGTAGCPVPPEVIMTPVFNADGVMGGSDSLTFGLPHAAAYGEWKLTGKGKMEATLVFLQGGPDNIFLGAFRTRYTGQLVGSNRLEGYVNVFFFPFADDTGAAILDPDTGFPLPDPLTPLGDFITDGTQCSPLTNGCIAVLKFVVRRITTKLDD